MIRYYNVLIRFFLDFLKYQRLYIELNFFFTLYTPVRVVFFFIYTKKVRKPTRKQVTWNNLNYKHSYSKWIILFLNPFVFHSTTKELVFGTKSSTGWGLLIWTSALNCTKPLSSLSRVSKVKLKKKSTPLSSTLVNYCKKSKIVKYFGLFIMLFLMLLF